MARPRRGLRLRQLRHHPPPSPRAAACVDTLKAGRGNVPPRATPAQGSVACGLGTKGGGCGSSARASAVPRRMSAALPHERRAQPVRPTPSRLALPMPTTRAPGPRPRRTKWPQPSYPEWSSLRPLRLGRSLRARPRPRPSRPSPSPSTRPSSRSLPSLLFRRRKRPARRRSSSSP